MRSFFCSQKVGESWLQHDILAPSDCSDCRMVTSLDIYNSRRLVVLSMDSC